MMFDFLKCFAKCIVVLMTSTPVFAGESHVIASGTGNAAPHQPQTVVDDRGQIHVVYGTGDVVSYCQSKEGGTVWTQPHAAFKVPNMSLGMRRGPRIAVSKDAIVVTAIGGVQGKGRDGDLQAWRSVDGGTTWQGPVRVNDVPDAAREGLHAMAADDDGTIWCVWLDLRNKNTQLYASKSTDGGATWLPDLCVYQSPDGSICECCHPSVNVSGGTIHVLFRNSLGGHRDMYLTSSLDGGQSFSDAIKVGRETWKLDACPMDGGMLAADSRGTVTTVWRRESMIYFAKGVGSPEQLLGTGQQPWVTSTSAGPLIVWTSGRDGKLQLQSPGQKQPRVLAGNARDAIVSSGRNETGPIVCSWESKRDDTTSLVVQVLNAE